MRSIRLPSFDRGDSFAIEVDGQEMVAYDGETIATVLLAAGINTFHFPVQTTNPSSRFFCGMGVCQQCLVTIDGIPSQRACQTKARTGMKIETHNDEK